MNIFDQYGIKEVADVTIYSIHKKKDGSGELYYVPALYLDTLKISSTEKTAENVWAQGGLGNSRLICWDYGKEINLSLEDALCTPASLGLCWGGILGSDWKDGKIKQDFGISINKNPVEKISRMEKAFYPKSDKQSISFLLPQSKEDLEITKKDSIISNSKVVDGTKVSGFGYVNNKVYKWNMAIESDMKSIAVVPEKFFDIYGNSYPIKKKTSVGVKTISSGVEQGVDDFKYEVFYAIGEATDVDAEEPTANIIISETKSTTIEDITRATGLCIRVDNNDVYSAYLYNGTEWKESDLVNTSQFKNIDMWNRFDSINEMIYFIITKYEDNIESIVSADITGGGKEYGKNYEVKEGDLSSQEVYKTSGKLWSYVNPKTMTPYPDDYWFSQGEPYYIKSLTFAPKNQKLKAQRISVHAGQFPGMYMIVGETYIRSRDTGEDERMQLKFPLCKIKSEQTLTLEAEGDPTVFNLDVEVARPVSGIMMELTSYEVAEKLIANEQGIVESVDGSTEVLSE